MLGRRDEATLWKRPQVNEWLRRYTYVSMGKRCHGSYSYLSAIRQMTSLVRCGRSLVIIQIAVDACFSTTPVVPHSLHGVLTSSYAKSKMFCLVFLFQSDPDCWWSCYRTYTLQSHLYGASSLSYDIAYIMYSETFR